MFIKVIGAVVSFIVPWESFLGFLLELAEKLIGEWLAEQKFTKKAKYFTMLVYVAAEGLGEELVADTKTTVDDDLVQALIGLCQKASEQQEFKLPDVEELLNGKKTFTPSGRR